MKKVKHLLCADNTGIQPMHGRLWLKILMVLVGLAYFWWIYGGVVPFGFLFDPGPVSVFNAIGPWNVKDIEESVLISVGQIAGALCLAYALLHCVEPKYGSNPVGLLSHCMSFSSSLLMFILGGYAFQAMYRILMYFHIDPMVTSGDGQMLAIGVEAQLLGVAQTTLGPIMEEITAFFLIVVILRRCNVPWAWVVCIEGILRVSYHLYEGIPALSHVIWICAVVVIYKCTGSLIGIIVAHEVADIAISYWPYDYHTIELTMLGIGVLLCVVLFVERRMRRNAVMGRETLR